jgi:hypothetical protein
VAGTTFIAGTGNNAVNVKAFGAVGNGVHDDTSAINAAIAYTSALTSGGVVYLPQGYYSISSPIVINGQVSIEAQNATITATHTGAGIQIGTPTGPNIQYQHYSGFTVRANTGTTFGLWIMRAVHDHYSDILVSSPGGMSSGYVGVRVSGGVYDTEFDSVRAIADAQTIGQGWWIGNGYNEVSNGYTNSDTYINCRAIGFNYGFHVDGASGQTFISPDAEANATYNYFFSGALYSVITGLWAEAAGVIDVHIDNTLAANGSGGFGAAVTSQELSFIGNSLPFSVSLSNSQNIHFTNVKFNTLTINPTADQTRITGSYVGTLLTNNGTGTDYDLFYSGSYHVLRMSGASVSYQMDTAASGFNISSTPSGTTNVQSIKSNAFGNLQINSGTLHATELNGTYPILQLDNIASAPGVALAGSAYLYSLTNGSTGELFAQFPTGAAQLIASTPSSGGLSCPSNLSCFVWNDNASSTHGTNDITFGSAALSGVNQNITFTSSTAITFCASFSGAGQGLRLRIYDDQTGIGTFGTQVTTTSTVQTNCVAVTSGVSSTSGNVGFYNQATGGVGTVTILQSWMCSNAASCSPSGGGLPATLVQTNQANTYTTGLQNFSAASVKQPATYTVGSATITQPSGSGTLALVGGSGLPNTLGCLQGYDTIPCVVYSSGLISQSTPSTSVFNFTPSVTGTYCPSGGIYATTASSTAYAVELYMVWPTQTGGLAGSGAASLEITAIGAGTIPAVQTTACVHVNASTAISYGTLTQSGTNTGGVWNAWGRWTYVGP